VTVTITFKSGGDKSPSSHTKLRLWKAEYLIQLWHSDGNVDTELANSSSRTALREL